MSLRRGGKARHSLLDLPALHHRLENLPFLTDFLSLSSLLKSCGELKALPEGQQIHAFIHRVGCENLIVLCHGLVSMYGKCGWFEEAQVVFGGIKDKTVVSWNSIMDTSLELPTPSYKTMV